jgi:hypothetical protein
MYDTVLVPCPNCGTTAEFQSKGGACILAEYTLNTAPKDVLSDINRHSPYTCEECGTIGEVKDKVSVKLIPESADTIDFKTIIQRLAKVIDHDPYRKKLLNQLDYWEKEQRERKKTCSISLDDIIQLLHSLSDDEFVYVCASITKRLTRTLKTDKEEGLVENSSSVLDVFEIPDYEEKNNYSQPFKEALLKFLQKGNRYSVHYCIEDNELRRQGCDCIRFDRACLLSDGTIVICGHYIKSKQHYTISMKHITRIERLV